MAVTNDIGNGGDIHASNKQEVSCSTYRSMAKRDGAVVLKFDHGRLDDARWGAAGLVRDCRR